MGSGGKKKGGNDDGGSHTFLSLGIECSIK